MTKRRYLPTLSDLLDRLSISQLKEVFIPEHRENYSQEIADILYDINLILKEEKPEVTADFLRSVIVLGIYNRLIWENESAARSNTGGDTNLKLSHSLNGVRNRAKNRIEDIMKGRRDHKVDCLGADHTKYEPSWNGPTSQQEEGWPLCENCGLEIHPNVPCEEVGGVDI